jgi:serine/threonine-protein kinase RsbT
MSPQPNVPPASELSISSEGDIVTARRTVRDAALKLGFSQTDVARIVTAASELARNVFRYAGSGVMRWRKLENENRIAIELQFIDSGPGIEDIELALTEGYSTGGGLGLGLAGAKRLSDEFDIRSRVGEGTTITLRKWRRDEFQRTQSSRSGA